MAELEAPTPAESVTKRHEATGGTPGSPTGVGAVAQGLLGRMRQALGGRDIKGEVAAYRMALKDASANQLSGIVERLIELSDAGAHAEALGAVAGVFDRLEPAKREWVLVSGHGHWGKAVVAGAMDVDPAIRKSVAMLIGRACDAETFGSLRGLLSDQDKDVAEAAGAALAAIAERAGRAPALDTGTRAAVERLVMRCVREFDQHRRREALGALLGLCCSPAAIRAAGMELADWLTDEEHPAHMALRGMVRRGDGLAAREAAWLWLGTDGYRSACVDRLCASCDAGGHERVLARGHLLANPMREAAIGAAGAEGKRGRAEGLTVPPAEVGAFSPEAVAHLPRWIGTVGGDAAGPTLEAMLSVESKLARLNALRQVADLAPGSDMILDWCFDSQARIARMGIIRAGLTETRQRLGPPSILRTMAALFRSEHEIVRESAAAVASTLNVLSDSAGPSLAAIRMLRKNREGLVEALQSRIRTGPFDQRIGAIRLAGRLRLGAAMELELLGIVAQSAEAAATAPAAPSTRELVFAASAAVIILADLPSPAATLAVQRCLRHPDARVRANALDAMARAGRRSGSLTDPESPVAAAIVEFKDDAHHRIRAGAAHALLLASARGEDARPDSHAIATTIMPLLTDSRPMHRVSGLWLAERMGGTSGEMSDSDALATTVAEMVRADPETEVKTRARRTASRLLARMRAGWIGRTASVR